MTSSADTERAAGTGTGADGSGDLARRAYAAGSALASQTGSTHIADVVVQKIAAIAAGEMNGVHQLGGRAARVAGTVRERIPGAGPSYGQGVVVQVGERQAAVDLDLVADYGVAIPDLADAVRRNVIVSIERMTGLEVTEVNINVDDVDLPGDRDQEPDGTAGRVE